MARGVLAGAGCRCHWQSRCLHKPGAYRALGRLVRKGSRDRAGPQSACQRTRAPALCGASRVGTPMGRGCNMQARQNSKSSKQVGPGPASERVQRQPARSYKSAGRYLLRYQRSAAPCRGQQQLRRAMERVLKSRRRAPSGLGDGGHAGMA